MRHAAAQDVLEFAVGHGAAAQVSVFQSVEFFIGIGHEVHLVHIPSIAHGIGIAQRHGLVVLHREDEIAGVEHIDHRIDAVAGHLFHLSSGCHHGIDGLFHLRCDVRLDEFLIAAQLGSVITAHTLVVVRRFILIEGVGGEVEHSVVEVFVLQYHLVGLGERLGHFAHRVAHEHGIVEVAFVHRPHIHETEQGYAQGQIEGLQLACLVAQQEHRTYHDDGEGAPAVGREDALAHLPQVGQQRLQLVGGPLRESLHFGRAHIVEEQAGGDGEEEGHTGGGDKAHDHPFHLFGEHLRVVYDLLEGHHGQQGDAELSHHENGCHRAELGIHGHMVDEEVGESHEVLSPGEHDRQHGSGEECPFHRSLHDKESQHEEHEHEGAHIDRTARTGLFAPVLPYLLIEGIVVGVGFFHGVLIGGQGHGGTALGVGDEQCPSLAYTVAPLGNIVALQSAVGLVGRVFLHQFALSAHGLL